MESNSFIKHLLCPLCQNILVHPKQLVCGHNACFGCLRRHVVQSVPKAGCGILDNETSSLVDEEPEIEFPCPVDGCESRQQFYKQYQSSNNFVQGIPNNLRIVTIVEVCRGQRNLRSLHCDSCKIISLRKQATSICFSCLEIFCQRCEILHKTTHDSHKLQNISTVDGCLKNDKMTESRDVNGPMVSTRHCKVHLFSEITGFCLVCAVEICEKCLQFRHNKCLKNNPKRAPTNQNNELDKAK
ncbi:hypothetical protein ACF0H5_013248 [Mactra antiquata]